MLCLCSWPLLCLLNCLYLNPWIFTLLQFSPHPIAGEWANGSVRLSCLMGENHHSLLNYLWVTSLDLLASISIKFLLLIVFLFFFPPVCLLFYILYYLLYQLISSRSSISSHIYSACCKYVFLLNLLFCLGLSKMAFILFIFILLKATVNKDKDPTDE